MNMILPLKAQQQRPRDLGIKIGVLPTGQNNGITDVSGVKVGHLTLAKGEATEEAIINFLFMGKTTTGMHGRIVEALPLDQVLPILKANGAFQPKYNTIP